MKCDSPIWVDGGIDFPGQDRVPVPCGRCVPCKLRRVDQWTFRLLQEDKCHHFAHFVTFTYDTRTVPISGNGFMTLDRSEFPRFMKRLRKASPDLNFKYYYCGEYGSLKRRPHYHAIIFGCPDVELFHRAWMLEGYSLGAVHIGTVSGDSIAYTMKYIDKGRWSPLHARDDRIPEFSGMSKGLGLSYVTPEMVKYHKADLSRLYCTKPGGFRVSMPRYYRDRIYSKRERLAQIPIIQAAVSEVEAADRLEFDRLYSDSGLSYEDYKSRQILGRVSNFNSKLKEREIS